MPTGKVWIYGLLFLCVRVCWFVCLFDGYGLIRRG